MFPVIEQYIGEYLIGFRVRFMNHYLITKISLNSFFLGVGDKRDITKGQLSMFRNYYGIWLTQWVLAARRNVIEGTHDKSMSKPCNEAVWSDMETTR